MQPWIGALDLSFTSSPVAIGNYDDDVAAPAAHTAAQIAAAAAAVRIPAHTAAATAHTATAAAAAAAPCALQVLDLYSPRWECLDDGSYTATMPWLKQRAAYSSFCGNKLYTLKPSMHEKLWELQVRALSRGSTCRECMRPVVH